MFNVTQTPYTSVISYFLTVHLIGNVDNAPGCHQIFMTVLQSKAQQISTKIQFLRAVAIIAVVLIHTCPLWPYQVVCRPFLNFAVALFLFLSGFLTNSPDGSWLPLYKKRICRVLIPYIIWSIVYTLPSTDAFSYIYNLVTTRANPTLYYIFVYIQLTLLAPFLIKLSKSSLWWIGIFVTPVAFLLDCRYLEWWTDFDGLHNYFKLLRGVSVFSWFSYYYLGILLNSRPQVFNFKIKWIFVALFCSIIMQIAEGYAMHLQGLINCGTQAKLTTWLSNIFFMLTAYIFISEWNITPQNRIMILLGKYSFGIYLLHALVIHVILSQSFIHFPYGILSIVVLLISLTLVILLSKICGKTVSKYMGLY